MQTNTEMGKQKNTANFHLPGLFEFFDFYKVFLPVFYNKREYFYEWVNIASLYGAPADCIWGGGRFGDGMVSANEVLSFLLEYGISARLTFSNSLLKQEHLKDERCNDLCRLFNQYGGAQNGIIVHSELLLDYLQKHYPRLYLVSSTTKVLTSFEELKAELERSEFEYVVPDFRLNKKFDEISELSETEKSKLEFLCNECCFVGCKDRKACYENVSRRILDPYCPEHVCTAPEGNEGYVFSKAMKNPMFISINDIKDKYLPLGLTNFKLEGRGLGSAVLLEFIIHYLVKPEYALNVREEIYLDSMLDLF